MKNRLPSLDGLRGIAALSVLIDHINLNNRFLDKINSDLLREIYNTFGAGSNGVQILFVLSGFLIALLYPQVNNKFRFIQKRYTRIVPIYLVAVTYFWLTKQNIFLHQSYRNFLLLLLLAIFGHVFWKIIKKADIKVKNGIFLLFVIFQVLILSYELYLHIAFKAIKTEPVSSFFTYLANITLTFPFTKKVYAIEVVIWSLVLELLFYILYPIVIVHVIRFGKRRGIFTQLFLIALSAIIVFALDQFYPSLARASSFIAGIVAAAIYQSKSNKWKTFHQLLKKPLVGIGVLVVFIFLEWGDLNFREVHLVSMYSGIFSNLYFFIASWLFALTILISIIPNTIPNKLFSNRILVFCGMVSYSLYLIHVPVIIWNNDLNARFTNHIPLLLQQLSYFLFSIISSIFVAYLLFMLVESLYFKRELRVKSNKGTQ